MIISTNEEIQDLIYTIRGKQVMLDSDVARLYHYETKNINKAMKRNIERFPEDFCFQLTKDELRQMWFQNGTTSKDFKYRSEKYLPYAFTEQGISMLAEILKSEIAVNMSIKIIKAFVNMRKFIIENEQVFERLTTLEYKQLENERKFNKVFNLLQDKDMSGGII
ncbi:MAG: ORF6N domain-containing protein [Clostridia bacterium]|nr:ORF6N domain-containing protein [Clostridia bacterium]